MLARYVSDHEQWRWFDDAHRERDLAFFEHGEDLDVYSQVMAYALMPLTPTLQSLRQNPLGESVARWCVNQGTNYAPDDPAAASPASLIGCLLGSLLVDIVTTGYIRSSVLVEAFERVRATFETSPRHWARQEEDEFNLAVLREISQRFGGAAVGSTGIAAEILFAVQSWQRLHWLAECRHEQALVFSSRLTRPVPPDPYKRFTALHRLGWSQPLLRRWPMLVRTIPEDPLRLLPPGDQIGLLIKQFARTDDDLQQRFLLDICTHRRYSLDHLAIIELEQSGLNMLTLTPEQRFRDDGFSTAFAVDHRQGVFFGQTHLLPNANTTISYLPLCDTLGYGDSVSNPEAATPNQVMDTFALLTAAAWRDLVSGRVRDEHYVSTLERKARKAKGRRAQSRADVDIVRYLPRRVAARRQQISEARQSGTRLPPRRYGVGAFSRRLPEGQKRSLEAEAFAQEIGMPLAPYQTVVHPHFRGGTDEDQADTVRRYRSWSALDLLRTRD